MAKVYTSTIQVSCRKEHNCVRCGGAYSYPFARTVKGQAGNAEAASQRAQVAARKVIEQEVDVQPCPTCGTVQPDMIGQQRARSHKRTFWVIFVLLVTLLILRGTDILQSNTATWIAVAVCALAAASYGVADAKNFNRDTDANRRLAADRVATAGVLFQPGRPVATGMVETAPRSMVNRVTLGLVFLSVVLAAAPELLRMSRGWPLNDECYTPVVGPGDSTRVYLPQKITSIKGYWRGTPRAALAGQGPGGTPLPVKATANENNWGTTISVKSSEKNSSSTPWVNLELPDNASLAGKMVDCDINLDIQFPEASGSTSFVTQSLNMKHSLKLALAPPGAGTEYRTWWWRGTLAATGLLIVCGPVLIRAARGLQRQAPPTKTYALNAPPLPQAARA